MDWFAKFMRNSGPARVFIPIGLILIAFGAFVLFTAPKEYDETVGTVTYVDTYEEYQGEDLVETTDLEFEYEVDGKKYTGTFSGAFSDYKVGDDITVFYDPANPTATSNTKDTGIFAIAMIVAGIAAIGYGAFRTVTSFKKSKEMDDQIKEALGTDVIPEIEVPSKGDMAEYYVAFDGKGLAPGYIVDDEDRDLVFEAPMTKQALVGARTFTFTNHKTGEVTDHQVGHTTTETFNNEWFSMRSTFKFDGKDIWDYLHEQGVRIKTDLTSILPKQRYTISINGKFAALVESSSQYVHEEDEAQHAIAIPFGRYYYRIWTNETDIELIFLTVFAISETEQAIVD